MSEPHPHSSRLCKRCGGPVRQRRGAPQYCLACGNTSGGSNRGYARVVVYLKPDEHDLLHRASVGTGKSLPILIRELALHALHPVGPSP